MLFETEKQPLVEVQRAFNLLHIIESYEWRCQNDGPGPLVEKVLGMIPSAQTKKDEHL
ncbi:MAG: hypothetical protein IJ228_06295 [Succinivibrio sp.]|nr:hypothetical protein [Succinivibrio sp.]